MPFKASGRLARWSLKVQAYELQIELRKGPLNVVPDGLSRTHMEEVTTADGSEIQIDLTSNVSV